MKLHESAMIVVGLVLIACAVIPWLVGAFTIGKWLLGKVFA